MTGNNVVSLKKMQDAAVVSLAKRNIDATKIVAQCRMYFDVSGSFYDEHRDGYTQGAVARMYGVASIVDPDKNLEVVAFSDNYGSLPDVTASNFDDYIKTYIMRGHPGWFWNGTHFAGPLQDLVTNHNTKLAQLAQIKASVASAVTNAVKSMFSFGRKSEPQQPVVQQPTPEAIRAECPTLVFIYTDGDPSSTSDYLESMRQMSLLEQANTTFVMFVGVGNNSKYPLPKEAAEKYGCVDFVHLSAADLRDLSDEALYDKVLATPKFVKWIAPRIK